MKQIEAEGLYVSYGQLDIIENMSISIPKNKITMIIGANGCGKSTLLKTMARILPPRKGTIKINGTSLKELSQKNIAKQMAFLPQSPSIPNGLLVKELISYGRYPHQRAFKGLTQKDLSIMEWAMEVTGLTEYSDRPVENLSGGQRQRAFIAMALAQDTELLLLDEPTTYLDMSHQLEILLLLQKLNKEQNRTIVMVLHELNNATRFADHIVGISNGKIAFEGEPKDVITNENLNKIYGIDAKLIMEDGYPICVNYNLV